MDCPPDLPRTVYRIADGRFPLFDGTGAGLHGGRWNSPGHSIIYASYSSPDVGLSEDGVYDALAFADNASLSDVFSLTFVWLDPTGVPGAQPYSIYNIAFETIESGTTVPAASGVPIPALAALVATGLVGLASVRRRKR